MKYPRLIYSNFSSTITNFNYMYRSVWICCAGLALIIINSSEADTGFSGTVSIEGYIILTTVAVYFVLNMFFQDSKTLSMLFSAIVFLDLLFNSGLAVMAYNDINYLFLSTISLATYSLVTFAIIRFQRTTDE